LNPPPKAPAPSTDWRSLEGPFDIIGDVHGCADELQALLDRLGYGVELTGSGEKRRVRTSAPRGRRAFFVGDFVDRGPSSPDVLRIAMAMVEAGQAFAVIGNHDDRFLRWMRGNDVAMSHGLEGTVAQFSAESAHFCAAVRAFLEGLPYHAWLEAGRLAVAHAGVRSEMLGRTSPRVRSFCLYGDSSGKLDAFGLPERYNWAADYSGATTVVYGHTPVIEPEWLNNTMCIDTGCVYGNRLTALRWPEREIVSVPAVVQHTKLTRPLGLPPPRPRSVGS
jgi:protein phosphatase